MQTVHFTGEFVTLGHALKLSGVVMTGGEVKWFLAENEVLVNGEIDQRRGRKLRAGDIVLAAGEEILVQVASSDDEDDSTGN